MLGLAVPLSVAESLTTLVAGSVVTEGDAIVVNDNTAPKLRPTAFEAMAQ
jgi:hypothetical protein